MKCPFCGFAESKVIDSRPAEEGATIRRRRECLACQKRFTTYEIIETLPLVVIKRDGSRQSFDKSKLINGMVRACDKRKVPLPVLVTVPTAALALCSVDRPPGLDTSMVTDRTITLPVSTVSLPAILEMEPVRVSKVESRVTEAL